MGRLLIVVLLALVVAWWLFGRKKAGHNHAPGAGAKAKDRATPAVDEMVACAHCRVHLPRQDAVADPHAADADVMYCGEEHRRLGPRRS